MTRKKTALTAILALTVVVIPLVALAADTPPPDVGPKSLGDIEVIIENIANFIGTIFMVIAVAFLIIAGIMYLTAGVSENKLDKAKKMLLYAVIAIAIFVMAKSIEPLLESVLGGEIGG